MRGSMVNYEAVGNRIRKLRTDKGMTQEELAFRLGSSAAYLSNIENGIKKHLQNPAILKKIYMESGSLEKNAEENETLSVSNVHITKMSSSYTFYPMWFIEPTFKNKKYSIIINDQNGSIHGNISP